jgi:hypothetical protein
MQMWTTPQSAGVRQPVKFPPQLREHELANMRDHLSTLVRIQTALSRNAFDEAADLADSRFGMGSFGLHGVHEVAKYMPGGMQQIGSKCTARQAALPWRRRTLAQPEIFVLRSRHLPPSPSSV